MFKSSSGVHYGPKNVDESEANAKFDDDASITAGNQTFDVNPLRNDKCYC